MAYPPDVVYVPMKCIFRARFIYLTLNTGANPASCTAAGAGLTTGVTADSAVRREFAVSLKDAYGNAATGAVTAYVGFSPDMVPFPWLASMPSAVTAVVSAPTATADTHGVAFTATYPGTYIVIVRVDGKAWPILLVTS